jgi:hypothetical protein
MLESKQGVGILTHKGKYCFAWHAQWHVLFSVGQAYSLPNSTYLSAGACLHSIGCILEHRVSTRRMVLTFVREYAGSHPKMDAIGQRPVQHGVQHPPNGTHRSAGSYDPKNIQNRWKLMKISSCQKWSTVGRRLDTPRETVLTFLREYDYTQ